MTKNKAFEKLYTLYHDKVFGYLSSRLNNRADAEDITSEVFLKLYSKSDDFDLERKGAASYIFKVTQSTLFDFFRKNKVSFVPLDEFRISEESDDLDLDDSLEALDKALLTLSDRERDIIILHYYDGISHKEIAGKMGLSYTNVRQICYVAIKKLKEKMNIDFDDALRLDDSSLDSVNGGLLSSYADTTIQYTKDSKTILIKKGGS